MIAKYLGGGLGSMLLMLTFGIPLYICASASTPIAAAFIMKGVSPGTALVFLLMGPATNITSLSVLVDDSCYPVALCPFYSSTPRHCTGLV